MPVKKSEEKKVVKKSDDKKEKKVVKKSEEKKEKVVKKSDDKKEKKVVKKSDDKKEKKVVKRSVKKQSGGGQEIYLEDDIAMFNPNNTEYSLQGTANDLYYPNDPHHFRDHILRIPNLQEAGIIDSITLDGNSLLVSFKNGVYSNGKRWFAHQNSVYVNIYNPDEVCFISTGKVIQ
jgi:hypothetical protein